MASLKEMRNRIGSVKSTQKITKALNMVAAAKLKRAQDATLSARPYSEKLDEVLADLAAVLSGEDHPLLAEREEGGKRLIVLVTTDRGLAGPLNTNTIRFASREITAYSGDLSVVTVGRKGRDAMRRAGVPIAAHFAQLILALSLVGAGWTGRLGCQSQTTKHKGSQQLRNILSSAKLAIYPSTSLMYSISPLTR